MQLTNDSVNNDSHLLKEILEGTAARKERLGSCSVPKVCFTTLYFSNFHLSALHSTSPFILHLAPAADIIGIKLVCGAALPRSFSHQRASKHLASKTHNIRFDVRL